MSDLPVIMSGPMVLATLREIAAADTGKTNTRRLAWGPRFQKAIDDEGGYPGWRWGTWTPGTCVWPSAKALKRYSLPPDTKQLIGHMAPSAWQSAKAGDRLWIRENVKQRPGSNFLTGEPINVIEAAYEADDADVLEEHGFNLLPWWKGSGTLPCIHMPRERSRITLHVSATKIERLNSINEADALAEGMVFDPEKQWWHVPGVDHWNKDFPILSRTTAREMFAALWDSLHGSGAWLANPEVVAIVFRPVLANIDALPKAEAA